jgi:hypothetical protein
MGWFSKVIDGVKASEGIASGFDRTVFGWLSKEYNKQCSSFVSANPVNTVDKTKTWPLVAI